MYTFSTDIPSKRDIAIILITTNGGNLRDLEDYQNKQVFRWQSTLASNAVTNAQPQNGDMRAPQSQGQQHLQQQNIKQSNRGYPPHRQEDVQPHTPYRQPPKRPYHNQQGRPGNEGNNIPYPRNSAQPNQGNWGHGAPSYQGNGDRIQYEGNQYGRGYTSNPPSIQRGTTQCIWLS